MNDSKFQPKWLIVLLLSLFLGQTSAQTALKVVLRDGEEQSFVIQASGKLSFDAGDLLISELLVSPVVIPVDNIRKLIFPDNQDPIEEGGINPVKMDVKKISIYPNPTNNLLRIANAPAERVVIAIFSINGQLLMRKEVNASEPVDVSRLTQGFYLIKINNTTLKFNKL
jgi:hypothetical protein